MLREIPRAAETRLVELATWLRVVIVNGPRQSGKTTLLRHFNAKHGGTYFTLDDAATRRAARDDPLGFARQDYRPLLIDEVQRGGDDLVRSIKIVVDEHPHDRGQFILSGSARFLTVPSLSESLAGRVGFVDLWPLSMAERTGVTRSIAHELFADAGALVRSAPSPWTRSDYLGAVLAGGYPEVLEIGSTVARQAWYDGYLASVVGRDISDFATIQNAQVLTDLVRLTASRAGGLVNVTELANATQTARETVRTYLDYLRTVFLIARIPAWSANLSARLVKSPKHYVSDSGLAAGLLRVDIAAVRDIGSPALGGLVESFVLGELTKLAAASSPSFDIFHYRDHDHREIDFVLEGPGGRVACIEVKAAATVASSDLRYVRWLRDRLGNRFANGIVLYLGDRGYSFGDRIFALPMSVLWDDVPLPRTMAQTAGA